MQMNFTIFNVQFYELLTNICKQLCKYYYHQEIRHFHPSNTFSSDLLESTLLVLSPSGVTIDLFFVPTAFSLPDYKWNHNIYNLICLASCSQQSAFWIHLSLHVSVLCSLLLLIFYCMNETPFVYPLTNRSIFFFLVWGNYE